MYSQPSLSFPKNFSPGMPILTQSGTWNIEHFKKCDKIHFLSIRTKTTNPNLFPIGHFMFTPHCLFLLDPDRFVNLNENIQNHSVNCDYQTSIRLIDFSVYDEINTKQKKNTIVHIYEEGTRLLWAFTIIVLKTPSKRKSILSVLLSLLLRTIRSIWIYVSVSACVILVESVIFNKHEK